MLDGIDGGGGHGDANADAATGRAAEPARLSRSPAPALAVASSVGASPTPPSTGGVVNPAIPGTAKAEKIEKAHFMFKVELAAMFMRGTAEHQPTHLRCMGCSGQLV
mmetsp:Transcript_113436/g.306081  ORF Transcript_113436/g.306081 Transcript_113436/m.306081 type:complete len:107 (+) Transcript_113436:279-599(+)